MATSGDGKLVCGKCPMAERVNGSALLCLIRGWYFAPSQDCVVTLIEIDSHSNRFRWFEGMVHLLNKPIIYGIKEE